MLVKINFGAATAAFGSDSLTHFPILNAERHFEAASVHHHS